MAPRSEKQREWHRVNADRVKKKNAEWLARQPSGYNAEKMRKWRAANPERAKAIQQKSDKKAWAEKKEHMVAKHRKWKADNAARWSFLNRKSDLRKYGLTPEAYMDILASQGGVCAICGTNAPGGNNKRTFSVDHDHETGAVRGLLCVKCNTGIGMFADNETLLIKAAEYVWKHSLPKRVAA